MTAESEKETRQWKEYWDAMKRIAALPVRDPVLFQNLVVVLVLGLPLLLVERVINRD